MDNKSIAGYLKELGFLLELHGGNDFKIRGLYSASFNIEKQPDPLAQMDSGALEQAVGKTALSKVKELISTGKLQELDELTAQTPKGVLEMTKIKGLGAKKIKVLWQEQEIDSLQKLKEACESHRISSIKGFGAKTEESILQGMAYLAENSSKMRYADVLVWVEVIEKITTPASLIAMQRVGDLALMRDVVEQMAWLLTAEKISSLQSELSKNDSFTWHEQSPMVWKGSFETAPVPVAFHFTTPEQAVRNAFRLSASESHLTYRNEGGRTLLSSLGGLLPHDVGKIYNAAGLPMIPVFMREGNKEFSWALKHQEKDLVSFSDLKGVLHNHTTYSDGVHSLKEMALYAKNMGMEYLAICDHSQTAAYANGLTIERVQAQHKEMDELNAQMAPFRIFKGIESDILPDGSLDYPDEVLEHFDLVVASVHAGLSMDINKATERLLKAIMNPYTTILGHLTGRLLLKREGYPLDMVTIIDACAEYRVSIELNANPYRLDIDWRWIDYCMEKGVWISINPDAHETAGYHDMEFGVISGRKGGLVKSSVLNALSLKEFENWLLERKKPLVLSTEK